MNTGPAHLVKDAAGLPFTFSDGTPSASLTISMSCQVILPRQPVFRAFRNASFAATCGVALCGGDAF